MREGADWDRLWTPHRKEYIQGANRPTGADQDSHCPFCLEGGGAEFTSSTEVQLATDDTLVVVRGPSCFVVLNLYPYNSGHLLICPYRHVPWYDDLTPTERAEYGELTAHAMRVLRHVANAQGFNLGMNQGSVAGAGIAAHLHQHIVPRWGGDTNFMPVVGGTRVLPELLEKTRDLLREAWFQVPDSSEHAG